MHFDARDRARVTRWSDVAFWLHLARRADDRPPGVRACRAAPRDARTRRGGASSSLVYAVLTLVALAIDRRALLVSALGYVIYAIQALVSGG